MSGAHNQDRDAYEIVGSFDRAAGLFLFWHPLLRLFWHPLAVPAAWPHMEHGACCSTMDFSARGHRDEVSRSVSCSNCWRRRNCPSLT